MNTRIGSSAAHPAAARLVCAALLLALGAPALHADSDDEAAAPARQRVSVQNGAAVVKLRPEEVKRAGIETTALTASTRRLGQPAFAAVVDLQPLLDAVVAFSAARTERIRADAELTATRAEFERARKLNAESQNVSTKDLQTAEAAWRAAEAAARAAEITLAGRHAALNQQWGPPLAAWIETGGDEFRRLLKGELLLVRVTQPGSAHRAAPPAEVNVRRPDGKWQSGNLVSAAGQASPEFQTEAYYFLVESGGGLLPGLNVPALLPPEDGTAKPGVVLPDSAVVWWQGRAWVYRETTPGEFVRTEIPTGQPEGPSGFFAAGFPADRPIVTRGAQVLLSEESKPAGGED